MPDCLKAHLKRGALAIRLTSRDWCGVALDECHEMKINKDAKLAVIRPTREKMRHISNYLPFRSACINNLKSQLFPEQTKQRNCYTPTSRDKAVETNAKAMLSALKSHGMVSTSQYNNSGLCTILHHKEATPAQSHDLLRFRDIGQESFEQYVRHRMLNDPSTVAPVRQKRLVTFTVTEAQKRRVKVVEKEMKMAQRVLKRQMAWMVKHEVDPQEINNFFGPTSSLPRALADRNGLPNKSAKSTTTKYIQNRYKDIPVILTSLPWAPTAVILEGMFIIQTPPFPTMEHMKEYAQMLFIRYVTPHYNRNATEVHVVFDNPGGLAETPKEIEQKRRDAASAESMDHKCTTFHSGTEVPKNWRALLACRRCKSALTSYLAEQFLELAPSHMQDTGQEFFTNVKGVAYTCSNEEDMMERPFLSTNMDEADMRVWLHCMHSNCTRIVIFSPDTDIYQIGLAIAGNMHRKSIIIIIQLSKSLVSSPKLLDLNALLLSITRDPDLSGIPPSGRPQALQTLYVCTGCDYVSFFAGIGKCSFLSTFFQHASFIASNLPPGSIGMISLNKQDESLFSFFRLVGCAYFRSHASGFEERSPVTLYNSVSAAGTLFERHSQWLTLIRNVVWLRADKESQHVPTAEALQLHWYRCLWVLGIWHSATENEVELPGIINRTNFNACTSCIQLFSIPIALTEYGWVRQESTGILDVTWDTSDNITAVQRRVEHALKGCKCKTGCATRRCTCMKEGRSCGPGCQCVHCTNSATCPPVNTELHNLEIEDEKQMSDDSTDTSSDEIEDENQEYEEYMNTAHLMISVFGEDSDSDD